MTDAVQRVLYERFWHALADQHVRARTRGLLATLNDLNTTAWHARCVTKRMPQAKERKALNVKRGLCIGGSITAILVLILVMTGYARTASASSGSPENLSRKESAQHSLCRVVHTASHKCARELCTCSWLSLVRRYGVCAHKSEPGCRTMHLNGDADDVCCNIAAAACSCCVRQRFGKVQATAIITMPLQKCATATPLRPAHHLPAIRTKMTRTRHITMKKMRTKTRMRQIKKIAALHLVKIPRTKRLLACRPHLQMSTTTIQARTRPNRPAQETTMARAKSRQLTTPTKQTPLLAVRARHCQMTQLHLAWRGRLMHPQLPVPLLAPLLSRQRQRRRRLPMQRRQTARRVRQVKRRSLHRANPLAMLLQVEMHRKAQKAAMEAPMQRQSRAGARGEMLHLATSQSLHLSSLLRQKTKLPHHHRRLPKSSTAAAAAAAAAAIGAVAAAAGLAGAWRAVSC